MVLLRVLHGCKGVPAYIPLRYWTLSHHISVSSVGQVTLIEPKDTMLALQNQVTSCLLKNIFW